MIGEKLECELGELGLNYLVYLSADVSEKKIESLAEYVSPMDQPILLFDLYRFVDAMGFSIAFNVVIKELLISGLDFSEDSGNLGGVVFQNCYFESIDFEGNLDPLRVPRFQNCIIENIFGRTSIEDLPKNRIEESCKIEKFTSNTRTNSGIRELDLPPNQKVMLIILKKLFLQSLSGRKEKALYAGLDISEKRLVPEIIKMLKSEGLIVEYKKPKYSIWIPQKAAHKRVLGIVSNPHSSKDELLGKCLSL